MSDEKQIYFKKELRMCGCKRIAGNKIKTLFEMNFNNDAQICFKGPYSKLFDLFRLIMYMDVYEFNAIKAQLKITNRNGDTLIIMPLITIDTTARFVETIPEDKIGELEKRHEKFLEANGLIEPASTRNIKTIMSEALNQIRLRGEKLDQLGDATAEMEQSSLSFLESTKMLRDKKVSH
tara:strand:+ start:1212 stop:1748 length:537 start_codon:yes stop_codon:yes gene_type:complete